MVQNGDTREQVTGGFLWKFAERITAQLVSFIISLILARILAPDHYGAVALVMIFITFANVFVSSGFGNALIQKKDADETDFSTVLYCSLAISCVLYILIFLGAPGIADFYNMPELTPVFRVLGIRLIIAAFNSVQQAYVSKHMLFRCFFWSTLFGTVLSGIVGILLAYCGFGIWALVAQYMVNSIVDTIVLFFTVKWRPKLLFSFAGLKGLFSYAWKILVSELINTGYVELRNLVIGKQYSSNDLAFYNKGQSFPKLVVANINASLQSVLFPAMSKVQDDIAQVKWMTRRSIRINSYIVVPLVVGLALVAKPFVGLLLTEAWLPCVPYLQLYCVFYCLLPIQAANLQAIKAVGRSDIYLRLEIIKKLIGVGLLLVSLPFGAFSIAAGAVLSNVISALMNVVPNRKLLGYTYWEQAKDYLNGIVPLLTMIVAVALVGLLPLGNFAMLVLQVCTGGLVYVAVSYILKLESFVYLLDIVRKFVKRK